MNNLKKSTQIILKELATRYPDSTEFRKNAIVEVGKEFGYTGKDWDPLMQKNNSCHNSYLILQKYLNFN